MEYNPGFGYMRIIQFKLQFSDELLTKKYCELVWNWQKMHFSRVM